MKKASITEVSIGAAIIFNMILDGMTTVDEIVSAWVGSTRGKVRTDLRRLSKAGYITYDGNNVQVINRRKSA